jgi:hypothetical protein
MTPRAFSFGERLAHEDWNGSHIVGDRDHLESSIGIPPGELPVWTVDASLLSCVLSGFQNPRDSCFQFWGKITLDWVSKVVPKIPRADEEDVNAVDLRDFFDLNFNVRQI